MGYFVKKHYDQNYTPLNAYENPAMKYMTWVMQYCKQGYELKKSFELTEEEYADKFMDREREEQRVLWGLAYTNKARSYLSYAE